MTTDTDTSMTDHELIDLIRVDPNEGLGRLLRSRLDPCLTRLRSLGVIRDCTVEDDLRSDILVYVWKHAKEYDPTRASLVTWLTAIGNNQARWKLSPPTSGADPDTQPHRGSVPCESVTTRIIRDAVSDAIVRLPPRQSKLAALDREASSGKADTDEAIQALGARNPNVIYTLRRRYRDTLKNPGRNRRLHRVLEHLTQSTESADD